MKDKYEIFELLAKIKKLILEKKEFPEDMVFSKEFYNKVHEIGYQNIMLSERILKLVADVEEGLSEFGYMFDEMEYKSVKILCDKTKELETIETNSVLDLLISVDKSIKNMRNSIESFKSIDKMGPFEKSILTSKGINLNIFDIDVI